MSAAPVYNDSLQSLVVTEVLDGPPVDQSQQPVLRLRLQKPKSDRKVGWREDTVDNEHLNKKKSKCCCIYKKPVAFGESSSEDDEECEHCFGHPEKRRKNRKHNHEHDHQHQHSDRGDDAAGSSSSSIHGDGIKQQASTETVTPSVPPDVDSNPPSQSDPEPTAEGD